MNCRSRTFIADLWQSTLMNEVATSYCSLKHAQGVFLFGGARTAGSCLLTAKFESENEGLLLASTCAVYLDRIIIHNPVLQQNGSGLVWLNAFAKLKTCSSTFLKSHYITLIHFSHR